MTPTLPRGFHRIIRDFGVFLIGLAACHSADPPVKPGPPLAAEPDITVVSMDDECNGLTRAIDKWRDCPNLEDEDRAWMKSLVEYADKMFAAGRAGHPE